MNCLELSPVLVVRDSDLGRFSRKHMRTFSQVVDVVDTKHKPVALLKELSSHIPGSSVLDQLHVPDTWGTVLGITGSATKPWVLIVLFLNREINDPASAWTSGNTSDARPKRTHDSSNSSSHLNKVSHPNTIWMILVVPLVHHSSDKLQTPILPPIEFGFQSSASAQQDTAISAAKVFGVLAPTTGVCSDHWHHETPFPCPMLCASIRSKYPPDTLPSQGLRVLLSKAGCSRDLQNPSPISSLESYFDKFGSATGVCIDDAQKREDSKTSLLGNWHFEGGCHAV
ncbi:hypothetical protein KCU64_g87, partial [Aureobasidium melanogenum]